MSQKDEIEPMRIRLGAIPDENGVQFGLYSKNAERVELCLFDDTGLEETRRIELSSSAKHIWGQHIKGIRPGQRYGYRVHGPYAPKAGHRFNANKLLIDPYAYAVSGSIHWDDSAYAYEKIEGKSVINNTDNAQYMLKSVVVNSEFDWEADKPPKIPMSETIIYELHVKGLTQLHPEVPVEHRGTYLGLTSPAVLDYLKRLGVTTLELLPCATSVTDQRLSKLQLSNYWGYDPIAMFAPDARFAVNDAVNEFKTMVKTLHRAGFEVILDVVYNHTGEGSELGPHLSFRGIDNSVYYRLDPHDLSRNVDTTGCGNSINVDHPQVLEMVLDCLRYWVTEMHVDGFRFDLATTIAREDNEFGPKARFFQLIENDPVLSKVKLIAEPWDLGYAGYQLGRFPSLWSEWNDQYRDAVRAYWRGDDHMLPKLVRRFAGSEDIFADSKGTPLASINFITAHDGFTLRDLVSYNDKHNLANGEDNRDGHGHNLSANYGVEGATDDPGVLSVRARQQRNLLATLLLSHGVPMLLAGDEINRGQQGNNNSYCQDNELSWVNWDLDQDAQLMLEFVRFLIELRKKHLVFRHKKFLKGKLNKKLGYRDVEWLRPDGLTMSSSDWHKHYAHCIVILLTGQHSGKSLNEKNKSHADHLLLILNASQETVECKVPHPPEDGEWALVFDTTVWPTSANSAKRIQDRYTVGARSVVLICEDTSGVQTIG